jgi:hypothetical protein
MAPASMQEMSDFVLRAYYKRHWVFPRSTTSSLKIYPRISQFPEAVYQNDPDELRRQALLTSEVLKLLDEKESAIPEEVVTTQVVTTGDIENALPLNTMLDDVDLTEDELDTCSTRGRNGSFAEEENGNFRRREIMKSCIWQQPPSYLEQVECMNESLRQFHLARTSGNTRMNGKHTPRSASLDIGGPVRHVAPSYTLTRQASLC